MATCGDYIILRLLGSGGFSNVMLARHKTEGNLVALKIMNKDIEDDDRISAIVKNEVEIMKTLDHQNIIKLLDYDSNASFVKPNGSKSDVFCIVLELARGGELFDLIALTGQFSEDIARYFFHQL